MITKNINNINNIKTTTTTKKKLLYNKKKIYNNNYTKKNLIKYKLHINKNFKKSKHKKVIEKPKMSFFNFGKNEVNEETKNQNQNQNQNNKNNNTINNKDYNMLSKINNNWVYKFYNESDDETMNKEKVKDKEKEKRCMCINYKSNNDFQSYDRCTNKATLNTDFCELHQNCKSYLRNFLSGYEPEYQPVKWSNPFVEGSHNCYSYFLNRQVKTVKEKCNEICSTKHKDEKNCPKDNSECTDLKPQPGDFYLIKNTGSDKEKERNYKCPNMQKKILNDNPSLIPASFNVKCPNKYYKGAMVVDPDNTYHFYRQNNNGTWDHKPGISPITNVDASGKPIYIPHFADRDYTDDKDNEDAINYTHFCGYYCIPDNKYIHKNLA
jgi:hypothetical protein